MSKKSEVASATPAPATVLSGWNPEQLYDVYEVTVRMRDKLCGGMPRHPDLLRGWIAATTEHNDNKTSDQEREAREALLEPTEEKSWNGFPADDKGLFIWSRQIKAMFKESATMLRITTQKIGSKQIFQHGFEIKATNGTPDRVRLGRDKADGYDEGPIHVQTAQGPRTAIKRVDYVQQAELRWYIWVLTTDGGEKRHVGENELRKMLLFAQENGLGADRSQGHGKFDVLSFKRLK